MRINKLYIHHKLVLFALMAIFLSYHYVLDNIFNLLYIINESLSDGVYTFVEYFLPKLPSQYFLTPFITVLGIVIVYLSITTKNEKINFGLIPVLIFYAYIFPWMDVWYLIQDPQLRPDLLLFILLVYGSVNLLIKAQRAQKIVKKERRTEELSDKEFIPTLLLCLFTGVLGIHRFFAGKVGTGILMIVTLGGLGIWVLVDFIIICFGSFRDKEGRIIKYQRAVVIKSEGSVAAELEKFAELKNKGVISEEEFNKKKEELL
tara:strand:+ start:493 stop:1275 length:783 start_codon:yes stop_codon:yes gene_type:complete